MEQPVASVSLVISAATSVAFAVSRFQLNVGYSLVNLTHNYGRPQWLLRHGPQTIDVPLPSAMPHSLLLIAKDSVVLSLQLRLYTMSSIFPSSMAT